MSHSASLIPRLAAIVGERHVLTRDTALLVYESDALPGYRKRPALAVFPGTRDETIAVMRALADVGAPFVPRGAGTGLSGGALADGVVLLGMNRLRRILALDADARTAVVEPGVVNATLTTAATPHGLHYAPDPSSQTACTIGGNVSENAGGPHCLKYGVTLNHILGATVVLPDGNVATLVVPASSADGYDLMGAYIGSEGCFGVTLDVTVRLTPNPEAVRTLLADFTSVDDAAHATSAIIASGVLPAACELMDNATIAAVEASVYAAGYPADAAAVLLVEVDGGAASVAEDAARVEALCLAGGARTVRVAIEPGDRARLWQGRKKAFGAMGRMAPHLAVQDAVVPRTKLAEILATIAQIADRHRVRVCNVFHAGDGNLHPNIPYDARNPGEASRVHAAMNEIMEHCIASGGTITGEHGVGLDKLPYMEHLFTADTLDAMCRLRHAFDPSTRANPGKVVPVRACREWTSAHTMAMEATHTSHTTNGQARPAVVVPRSPAETRVADAIAHARATGTRVSVAGARTRHTDVPAGATIVDVADSTAVIAYVPSDLTITVGAGMTLAQLDAITGAHDQWCPLLPWGSDASTIGGTLASGARGPAHAQLGAPRDLALGLTFVDGRGAVVSAGGRVVKNVAGFDLTRALIGSWGSLGVIVSASLRLRAKPLVRETWAVPARVLNEPALADFVRGSCAPLASVRVPAGVAASLGLAAEPHAIIWLGGGAAHVSASRAILNGFARGSEIDERAWTTIRAHGPFDLAEPRPLSETVVRLNTRVRDAFDPDRLFAAPAFATDVVAAHA